MFCHSECLKCTNPALILLFQLEYPTWADIRKLWAMHCVYRLILVHLSLGFAKNDLFAIVDNADVDMANLICSFAWLVWMPRLLCISNSCSQTQKKKKLIIPQRHKNHGLQLERIHRHLTVELSMLDCCAKLVGELSAGGTACGEIRPLVPQAL